jgi:hypothetical protein
MRLILLSDNDIIIKLACCELLDEFVKSFGAAESDFRVLASARFKVSPKNKQMVAEHGIVAVQRAHEFICRLQVIEVPADSDDERLALARPGIDPGEQILFSASRNYPKFSILTGDKNSLRTLLSALKIDSVKKRLAGRVECFEAIMLKILTKPKFALLLPRIVAGAKCDTALQVVFGLGLETTYEKAIEGLNHYLSALRAQTGKLLAD